jgi:hypothetical protein
MANPQFLQPAAGAAALTGTVSSFSGATAGVVSGIISGGIRLDVTDTEAWLNRFAELAESVRQQRQRLIMAARQASHDPTLGSCELSDQIRAKLADRLGAADGGFAGALEEVYQGLMDIHEALRAALATHMAADRAGADAVNGIPGGAPGG